MDLERGPHSFEAPRATPPHKGFGGRWREHPPPSPEGRSRNRKAGEPGARLFGQTSRDTRSLWLNWGRCPGSPRPSGPQGHILPAPVI